MNTVLQLLLLEDDPADAELILNFLRKSGLESEAVIVSDGQEYATTIRTKVFDAILADNSLPQYSSSQALGLLQKTGKDTAFILVTGTVSEEFAVEITHKGADDYILKNNLTRLPTAILQAIERRKDKREKLDAEAALIQSEIRYRTLFQRNPAGIYQSGPDGRISDCNNAFSRMLGYAHSAELRAVDPRNLFCSEEDRRQFMARVQYEKFLSNHEFMLRRKDGSGVTVLGNLALVETPETGSQWIEGMLIDISERRKAENEIREINRELRELSSHLQHVREEERTQIARDVHDDLGQLLTALKMDVHALKKQLAPDGEIILQKFNDIFGLIEKGIQSVRGIAADLRPSIIDDLGLTAALIWHSQEVEKRSGVRIGFICEPEEIQVPPEIVTDIFRIYQEALTNVVRHAQARAVQASLTLADGRIRLAVSDDGIGFDARNNGKRKSFGLLGIRERVLLMGGEFELKSEPGKGTMLNVSVPARLP
ncbi:MAG TPA: PAS domain S-box protein [Puia sp.]|uniref:PAS domain S-box protein n=1 Tax=Puia sp. TaxID=2045100 RepID=UPI002BED295F|nr:PAS domain S-box protein [Puia sp.]HVU94310.1 PAS domain S-box protein [Puia sp.]